VGFHSFLLCLHAPSDATTARPSNTSSLQNFLQSGALGSLLTSLDKIKEVLSECKVDLEFPVVVMCGQENTGKSSVLERICMFPFFPRSEDITTRMPIKLRLIHCTFDQLEAVARRMKKEFNVEAHYIRISFKDDHSESSEENIVRNTQQDASEFVKTCQKVLLSRLHGGERGFIQTPLVIEAWSMNVPDLELVDLPGVFPTIVDGEPEDIVRVTREITEEYLRMPNALVVVVVPGDCARVRNDMVLGMVREAHKEHISVCALTKADRCKRPEHDFNDPFKQLKARARGIANDCPNLGGGYVAIRNRDTEQLPVPPLAVAAAEEVQWFQKELPDLLAEGKATAGCLVEQIGKMMIRFTKETWVPSAQDKLASHRKDVMAKVEALGTPPRGAMLPLIASSCGATWVEIVSRAVVEPPVPPTTSTTTRRVSFAGGFDLEEAERFKSACEFFEGANPCSTILLQLDRALQMRLASDTTHPVQLHRFQTLRDVLSRKIIEIGQLAVSVSEIRWRRDFAILRVVHSSNDHGSRRQNMCVAANNLACTIVQEDLLIPLSHISFSELLAKANIVCNLLDESCATERQRLQQVIEAIDRALVQVSRLDLAK
jgi:GTP-binding protein EngB required for normal cell division